MLSPGGCLPLLRGYIHVLNHEKEMYKIRLRRHFFFKLATNEWSGKTFLLTSKLCPLRLSAPAPWLYTYIKLWKKLYNIRLQRDFFEICNKWPKWQDVPVDIKLSSPRGCQSSPAPRLYTCIKSWFFFSVQSNFKEIFFLTCSKWPKW